MSPYKNKSDIGNEGNQTVVRGTTNRIKTVEQIFYPTLLLADFQICPTYILSILMELGIIIEFIMPFRYQKSKIIISNSSQLMETAI